MPSEQQPGPIRLNILPPQYRPRIVSPVFKIAWVVAIILLVGAVPLWVFSFMQKAQVRTTRDSVAQAQRTLAALRTPAAEEIALTGQLSTTLESLAVLEAAHASAVVGRKDWAPILTSLLNYDTARLRLEELYQDGDQLTLTGVGLTREDALAYASGLDRAGVFEQVAIQALESSQEPFYTPTPRATTTVTPTATLTKTAGAPTNTPTPTTQPYDDFEIDDLDPKPISIGEIQEHNFNPIYDADTVSFLGKAGRRYCIVAMPQHYGVDTFVEVTAGTAVLANDDCQPSDDALISCRCPSEGAVAGLASLVELQVPLPEDQQVRVRITNRDQYGVDQRYNLYVLEVTGDAWERDDLTPKAMGVGEVQERTFYPYGDVDRVTFPVKAGRAYEVRTSALAVGVDTSLAVFANGQAYTNDDAATGDPSSKVEFQADLDGTVTVNVTNKGQYGVDLGYKLEVHEVGGDEFEPDDYDARPLSPYEKQRHTFYPEDDVDLAEFNVKAGQTYEVKTLDLAVGVDTELSVSVGGKTYHGDDVSAGNQASAVVFTAKKDGHALVTVRNREQYGTDKIYYLIFTPGYVAPTPTVAPSTTPTLTPTPDGRDAFESDDGDGRLIALGEAQVRSFYPAGDVDRAWFYAKPGYAYEIETTGLAVGVDTDLTVVLGVNTYSNDDRSTSDRSSLVRLLHTGTSEARVLITVRNKEYFGTDKSYTLRVNSVGQNDAYEPDEGTPAPIAFGAAQERTFYPAGDVDRVIFTAKPAHRYRIYTKNLAAPVDTVIEATMGVAVFSNDDIYPGDLSSSVEMQNDGTAEQQVTARITNKGQYSTAATYLAVVDDLGTVSGDVWEPDESIKRYLSVGEGQRHTFHPESDWDRVSVKVKAGRQYTMFTCGNPVAPNLSVDPVTPLNDDYLQCTPLMPGVDTELVVSGPPVPATCATCTNDDALPDAAYQNSRVQFTAQSDGEAVVHIYNKGLYGPDKEYYVRAYALVPCAKDAFEPDDALPVSITLGAPQARVFDPTGDIDRVFFTAQTGHRYRVYTKDLSLMVDTVLEARIEPTHSWSNDDVAPGDPSSSLYVLHVTGVDQVVTVQVTNKGSYDPCARYALQVDDLGAVAGAVSEPAAAVAMLAPAPLGTPAAARPRVNLSDILPSRPLLRPRMQAAAPDLGVVRFTLLLKMRAVQP